MKSVEELIKWGVDSADDLKKLGITSIKELKKYGIKNADDLAKLGINSAEELKKIGITTPEQLKKLGITSAEELKKLGVEIENGKLKKIKGGIGTKFKYKHNPSDNPKVLQDATEDADAVYGYSPNPNSSRIGEFAEYDWTDEGVVSKAKEARLQYHKDNESIYIIVKGMREQGRSTEEIAKVASQQRNVNRLQSYIDRGNMAGYEKAVNSNLKNFGNKYGMTPEQAFEKYGSWEKVLEKATSANAGMDACCGLYDDFYYLYPIGGK